MKKRFNGVNKKAQELVKEKFYYEGHRGHKRKRRIVWS